MPWLASSLHLAIVLVLSASLASPQTTQGIIRGRVTDSQTGLGVSAAAITLAAGSFVWTASTRADGGYAFPLVSPGEYVLRAAALNYQPCEVHGVVVAIAGIVQADLVLRPAADVWEQGEYRGLLSTANRGLAPFFGPDIDRSRTSLVRFSRSRLEGQEPALSQVVTSHLLRSLPLAGRDAYALLVLAAGVTADAGTARGLGVAVNGQRPSASNFLLDGVENQNYVIAAPQSSLPPEAIEEYRLSTNNFSAEFGRSSGLLANGITRSGSANWHGLAYAYAQHEILNANGFQQNRLGVPRAPLRQWQPGGTLGGPWRRDRTFVFSSFEHLRTRTRLDPRPIELPSTAIFRFAPDSPVRPLIERFAAPYPNSPGGELTGTVRLAPPSSLDRSIGSARLDHLFGEGRHRIFSRLLFARVERPDFVWSPYPDFVSALGQRTISPMISLSLNHRPLWTSDFRFVINRDRLGWDRPHPEIPTLTAGELWLPGSPLFFAYRNVAKHAEFNGAQTWAGPRHVWKWGGGLIARSTGGELTAGRDGRYSFLGIGDFLAAFPAAAEVMVARGANSLRAPDYARNYRLFDGQFFVQDAYRWTPTLLLSAGLRYETFGAPSLAGTPLFGTDRNNFALRIGLSWQPRARSPLLAKIGYGTFYDRPFDNQWQNLRANSLELIVAPIDRPRFPILDPIRTSLVGLPAGSLVRGGFPEQLVYQSRPRTAYVHSGFASLSSRLGANGELEVAALGALGRKLITTDKLNRNATTFTYRGNQGASTYLGASATWRYRSERLTTQASYTWSHTIDNQSEPLAGDFFDLSYVRDRTTPARTGVSAFTREGDARADRGSADFDQRHNATWFALWRPGWARGWQLGVLAAARSGFPYSVFALPAEEGEVFYNLRADLAGQAASPRTPADGGARLLDERDFRNPRPGRIGATGRNAFTGPGFVNLDLSLERAFRRASWPESHRFRFRTELFNAANHANLGTPDNQLGSETFGLALRGRRGRASSFPALVPFVETGRQVQFLLRYEF